MEPYEIQQQKDVQVPDSLLTGIMQRLEQRQHYLAAETSVQELIEALQHPEWTVRSAAVHALGNLGEQAPLTALLTALHDEHRLVRMAAVRALGQLDTHAPLADLLSATGDHAWEVREMAATMLDKLGARSVDPIRSRLHVAEQSAAYTVAATQDVLLTATPTHTNKFPIVEEKEFQQFLPVLESVGSRHSLVRLVERYAVLFKRQTPLIHKSVWLGTPLLLLFWGLMMLPHFFVAHGDLHTPVLFLALFTTVAAATGSAFIYGAEHDAGFEITLATSVSVRVVMFSRFLLVIGYNMLLASGASFLVTLLHQGAFWETTQLWIGPMVLLSSLTLTASLIVGSWFSILLALIVEASQTLIFKLDKPLPALDFSFSSNWQTSPIVLLIALILLTFAVLYVPRQPRLSAL